MEGTIEQCQRNPDLKGIQFEIMDIVSLKAREHYDLITVNAVLYLFPEEKFASALSSIANALRAGGRLIAFDFFHSFRQELAICEKSASHPKGLMLHFRSYALVGRILAESGFSEYHFHPFHIPIDLERGKTYSDNKDGFEDLNSYTVRAEEGERLLFRGTLFQPWCHLVAQKS